MSGSPRPRSSYLPGSTREDKTPSFNPGWSKLPPPLMRVAPFRTSAYLPPGCVGIARLRSVLLHGTAGVSPVSGRFTKQGVSPDSRAETLSTHSRGACLADGRRSGASTVRVGANCWQQTVASNASTKPLKGSQALVAALRFPEWSPSTIGISQIWKKLHSTEAKTQDVDGGHSARIASSQQ